MQIFFHTKEVDLEDKEKEYMEEKLHKIAKKFFSPDLQFFISLEKTRGDLHGDDLYETSIKAEDMGKVYFAEDRGDTVLKSFDEAHKDFIRIVRRDRGKTREILKRAGRKIKSLLRKSK